MNHKHFLFRQHNKRFRGMHIRNRKGVFLRWREYIWPSMGLMSFLRYTELKVKRQRDAQHRVALGLAIGAFFGCVPLLGQFFLASYVAWLLRANVLMAAVGSFINNPWTFAVFMAWNYKLGHWLLGNHKPPPLPQWDKIFSSLMDVYFPMLLGGVMTGVLAAILLYVLVRVNLVRYQAARTHLLQARKRLRLAPRHG